MPTFSPPRVYRSPEVMTRAAAIGVVAVFALLAYGYRWCADDGLITVRIARQILAGNGPNYNRFQRIEVDTSPAWTWLLAAFSFVVKGDVAVDAVLLGGLLSVGGLVLAILGSRDLQYQLGRTGVLVPVGALVPLAASGFAVFATSGLETGLSLFWMGLVWWLLVKLTPQAGWPQLAATAVVIGAGPLVRPEFVLAAAVFGIAALLAVGWRRGLPAMAIGVVAPIAYQIFRMGYYGHTVPMTALAKEASSSLWMRGAAYLANGYPVWIPLIPVAAFGLMWWKRTTADRRGRILVVAPLLAGLLLGGYVVKVGGDYMHVRMWIPVAFALILPVLLLPVTEQAMTVWVAPLACWTVVAALCVRPNYQQGEQFGFGGIVDERGYEIVAYADPHPVTTISRTHHGDHNLIATLADIAQDEHTLIMRAGPNGAGAPWTVSLDPSIRDHQALFLSNLGITAAIMPLDSTVVDPNGLASPIGGHLQLTHRGRPGHEKWLPPAWAVAQYADPAFIAVMGDNVDMTRVQVVAARHALSCGALGELMDATTQPLTWHRFWANLTGAVGRTALRIPADPLLAQQLFCGTKGTS